MPQRDTPNPLTPYPRPSSPQGTPEVFSPGKAVAGVIGLAVMAGGLALFLSLFLPFVTAEPIRASIPTDGAPHDVLIEPGLDALLTLPSRDDPGNKPWFRSWDASCTIVDSSRGSIRLSPEPSQAGWSEETGAYIAFGFDAGSGHLRVTCTSPVSEDRPARIMPAQGGHGPQLALDNGFGMLCGMALSFAGFVLSTAMLIGWISARRDRRLFDPTRAA
ncbi:hypothetical protein OG984_11465 [Nocardioides sp. NBC_00368]|uniref:hypothetical protein n=1 Tax=Nocardioides sp. NBC_00368 TaxID=2976000 RepID=UPI002E1ADBA8